MNALAASLRTVIGWLVAAALFLMMLITLIDVIGRYVVNRPLPGANELVQYMMVLSVFLALPIVTFQKEHISISLIDSALGPTGLKLQRTLINLLSALVVGLLSVRLWTHGGVNAANRDVIGFLELPVAPAAFLASILCAVTVLVLVALIVLEWRPGVSQRKAPDLPRIE